MQSATHSRPNADEILANLPRRSGVVPMFIGGEWTLAADGVTRDLINPSNGRVVAAVAEAGAADAERAIDAARAAFDDGPWSGTSAADRAALLFKVADAVDRHRDEFMRIDTLNGGKPLRETEYDAVDAANCFRYYAGLATKPHGQTFDVPAPSQTFTVREPIGVCGQIIPWNYPLLMAVWKLAPALAAGNVCVLKPSELTPLSAIRLAAIFEELEFPPGVLNVVTGPGATAGNAIAASTRVDKVAFTGGTKTGRSIMQAATSNLKKISLELGGKSPNVVFADADFDTAVDYALFGIFANAGQVCSAGSRLIVERALHDRFLGRLAERARKIRVGDGFDPQTEMGPIISPVHRERVEGYIAAGKSEGAELVCGGERLGGELADGNFIAPTIFDRTSRDMRIVQEEIFGPVLVVQTFDDEAEAIRLANDTIYGLAGAVFTEDVAKAHRVIRKMRAGITWINTYHPTYNEAPWGGYKQSGIGRELGTYGYDAYTEVKQINVNLDVAPSGWFSD
ncbi:MAG: aldehyde dehydrogenase family protein [Candidatus Eremiobacteraeota bacterium]|nr:aldehyde dehydrogenase family protein [Candidatus Eremiobacteraeota bacterium]MBV9701028.1 aldehyde dehydrogenase family protein [Candidatus Eremiobacteraeota bacterium]